jgi:hypothetical protein
MSDDAEISIIGLIGAQWWCSSNPIKKTLAYAPKRHLLFYKKNKCPINLASQISSFTVL